MTPALTLELMGVCVTKSSITVIVPTFDRPDLLRRTLRSLCEQDLEPERFDVVVCDDGSSMDSLSVVRELVDDLEILYAFQADRGFRVGRARNLGIAMARGDVCLFVDDGMVLVPSCLRTHLERHAEAGDENHTVLGPVHGYRWDSDRDAEIASVIDSMSAVAAVDELVGRGLADPRVALFDRHGRDLSAWPASWVVWWGANVSVPTRTLRDLGGFDEAFTTWGGEDSEMALRLFSSGIPIVLAEEAASLHLPHQRHHRMNDDPARSLAESERKKDYLFGRYPFHAVDLWRTVGMFELNAVLGAP